MMPTERRAVARATAIRKLRRAHNRALVEVRARRDYAIVAPVDTIGHAVDRAVRENA